MFSAIALTAALIIMPVSVGPVAPPEPLTPQTLAVYIQHLELTQPPPIQLPVQHRSRRVGHNVEQWRPIVEQYFTNVDAALRVMTCESGGNPDAKNRHSTAAGLFQFLRGTWDWVAKEVGLDSYESGAVYDPVANIRAAAWLSKGGTWWAHWECKP